MPKNVSMRLQMAKLAVGSTEVLMTLAHGMSSLLRHQNN